MSSDRHEQKKATMRKNLAEKTGKNIDTWADLVREAGIEGFGAQVSWLKENHNLGHFQARAVAEHTKKRG